MFTAKQNPCSHRVVSCGARCCRRGGSEVLQIEVRPGLSAPNRSTDRSGVRECLIADGDPYPMQKPSISAVTVEAVAVAHGDDLCEQSVQLKQRVPVRSEVCAAHSSDAASRSGLTCSLCSTTSENGATSAPSSSLAASWKANGAKGSLSAPTWPRNRPGPVNASSLIPCSLASSTSVAACDRTCSRQLRRFDQRLADTTDRIGANVTGVGAGYRRRGWASCLARSPPWNGSWNEILATRGKSGGQWGADWW
jgi:cytochrome c5